MFADVEMGTLKKSLTHFAENISAVQDYRQAQVCKLFDPIFVFIVGSFLLEFNLF